MVLMRGWAVVVLRMIVPDVPVHVQICPRSRRYGEGLKKHECDESAHEISLLRSRARSPATSTRERGVAGTESDTRDAGAQALARGRGLTHSRGTESAQSTVRKTTYEPDADRIRWSVCHTDR